MSMTSRAAPWRSKPSQVVLEAISQLTELQSATSNSCYVLQRLGPASFVVGQDPRGDKYKVTLGNEPTCSCRLSSGVAAPPGGVEPCVHLLFILLRVMRLASNNPLLWQSALTDRELQELLDGRLASNAGSRAVTYHKAGRSNSSKDGDGATGVQRRCVEQDEPCPICYEDLSVVHPGWLVWCSNGCGRNIHGKCMRVWSDHQVKTLHQDLTCPLCRCAWGPLNWTPPPVPAAGTKVTAPLKPCHKGVHCCNCKQDPIEGIRYRCLQCGSYDLCSACFRAGVHLQHSFVYISTTGAAEHLAERQMQGFGLQCSGVVQNSSRAADRPHANTASSSTGSNSCSSRQNNNISGTSSNASRNSSASSSSRVESVACFGSLGLQGNGLAQGIACTGAHHSSLGNKKECVGRKNTGCRRHAGQARRPTADAGQVDDVALDLALQCSAIVCGKDSSAEGLVADVVLSSGSRYSSDDSSRHGVEAVAGRIAQLSMGPSLCSQKPGGSPVHSTMCSAERASHGSAACSRRLAPGDCRKCSKGRVAIMADQVRLAVTSATVQDDQPATKTADHAATCMQATGQQQKRQRSLQHTTNDEGRQINRVAPLSSDYKVQNMHLLSVCGHRAAA